jgi:hypothetical protein
MPLARKAWARCLWVTVMSFQGSPLRARGTKCQLSRSSSLKSKPAFCCCSGVRAAQKFSAAVAISPAAFASSGEAAAITPFASVSPAAR